MTTREIALSESVAFINGKIETFDDADSIAEQIVVQNGRIAGVGNNLDLSKIDRVIDLQKRTVIPGIIEGHVHVVSLANRPGYHTPIENSSSIEEVLEALAARRPDVPPGEFITSMGGWHVNQVKEHRLPTLRELDEAVADRPILIFHQASGPAATNSLGKAFFESADPAVAVSEDGQIEAGLASTTCLYHLRKRQTFEDKKRSTLDAMSYAASVGLTALLDEVLVPVPGPLVPTQRLLMLDHYKMYDSWLALHREGKTFVRLQMNFLHNQDDPELPELKERLRNQFQFFGDDMMMTGAIGEWAAPGAGEGSVWLEAQRLVAEAGWRNENSANSLESLEKIVAGYEKVNAEFDISRLRWMVHHIPFVTNELLDRLEAMGCGVQARCYWTSGTLEANGAPFRQILDHGIKAGIHGDGAHLAPLSPWPHIYYATTGVNARGELINDAQQITRREAIRMFTRGNSWFLRMEDKLGTLEVGKLADFVVLNQDYNSVSDEDLKKTRPAATVINGRVVYGTI